MPILIVPPVPILSRCNKYKQLTSRISQKEKKKTNYKQGQLGAALEEASKTRFSMYA